MPYDILSYHILPFLEVDPTQYDKFTPLEKRLLTMAGRIIDHSVKHKSLENFNDIQPDEFIKIADRHDLYTIGMYYSDDDIISGWDPDAEFSIEFIKKSYEDLSTLSQKYPELEIIANAVLKIYTQDNFPFNVKFANCRIRCDKILENNWHRVR